MSFELRKFINKILKEAVEPVLDNLNDNFKSWFGSSKVSSGGVPIVVYHGTSKKFSKFNIKKSVQPIIWFTSNKSAIEAGEVGAAGSGHIMELYASIQNPAGWEEYEKYGLGQLKGLGYDGAILPDGSGNFDGFVFEPNQLKSVKNKGEWNSSDKNIYKEDAQNKEHNKPYKFYMLCDKLCNLKGVEVKNKMVADAKPITKEKFVENCAYSEEMMEYEGYMLDDPSHGFYESNVQGAPCMYMQYAGFEFIFLKGIPGGNEYWLDDSGNTIEENADMTDYKKWKRKNVTYRGISSDSTLDVANGSSARFGRGLYMVPLSNKAMAKGYGTVYYVVNGKPKNPMVFRDANIAEIWIQQNLIFKKYKDAREFEANTSIEQEMLKLGYDGIEIKGREIVNFTPENVKYYLNDNQLIQHYEYYVEGKNELRDIIKNTIEESFVLQNIVDANIEKINTVLSKNGIEGGFLNKQQVLELKKEIESNYLPPGVVRFGNANKDIRTNLFNYDNPVASKNLNGIDLRVAVGLIRKDQKTGLNKKSYLLYADGNIIGEFYSVNDIKRVINFIEKHLLKKVDTVNEAVIDEEYPQHFDMNYFKALKTFKQRIQYCQSNLQRLAAGSSRIVYKIDDEKVLKLAKNGKGIAQNEVEIDKSSEPYLDGVVAKTFDHDEDNLWVEMELAKPINESEFKRITGFEFKDYVAAMHNAAKEAGQDLGYKMSVDPKIEQALWNDQDFAYSMLDFVGSHNMPIGDLTVLSSYGVVKRNGHDVIVLVDYGFTEDVYNTHYSRKKVGIREMKQVNGEWVYSGRDVNNHIKSITPDSSDLPFYFMKNLIAPRKFKIQTISLIDLLNTDKSFKEYYESFKKDNIGRYDSDIENGEGPHEDELYNEPVVVDGELLDGYNRCSVRLRNGETEVEAFVALPKKESKKIEEGWKENLVVALSLFTSVALGQQKPVDNGVKQNTEQTQSFQVHSAILGYLDLYSRDMVDAAKDKFQMATAIKEVRVYCENMRDGKPVKNLSLPAKALFKTVSEQLKKVNNIDYYVNQGKGIHR